MKKLFAIHLNSTTNKSPSNLHDLHSDMKSLYSSNRTANPSSHRLAKACALVVILASGALPAAHGFAVHDFGTFTLQGPTSKANWQTDAFVIRTTPYSTILGYTVQGYNGFGWDGSGGFYSSNAAADAGNFDYTYAVANNADPFASYPTFFGKTLTGAETVGRFTFYGDADMSGKIDASDYFYIGFGFDNALTGWTNGDFDYSGAVDASDYFLIGKAFGDTVDGGGVLTPLSPAYLADGGGKSGSLVPEPTTVGLLGLGALGLLNRRRRSNGTAQ